ncbi:DUF1134 domain-containing protein [Pseudoxanthobacter sp.]|uniref:DUF1134 domain-containing protein n=1 Tax=Pseudoxanthobacter sp. TaxID=1925742 RepID=UPI002FE3948C
MTTLPLRLAAAALGLLLAAGPAAAQTYDGSALPEPNPPQSFIPGAPQDKTTYSADEIVKTGNHFFGQVSSGLATVVERAFGQYGEPNAYILGSEASGAFLAGLRYGEGDLYRRHAAAQRVYWQGPSLGFDWGGDGARVMMLVYQLPSLQHLFRRYAGINGSAYVIGGFGMTVLNAEPTYIVPVRAGLGARLGVNVGYLKFSEKPTWNPF